MFWGKYQKVLLDNIELSEEYYKVHQNDESKIHSKIYSGEYVLKSRETYIEDGKTFIYNNIIYPKTGKELPCLGIDLMAFWEKKVIIVFDFQHPKKNYQYYHPLLDDNMKKYLKITKDIRFFEYGNHFSQYVYVKKCKMSEIENYLSDFEYYVKIYSKLLNYFKPFEYDESEYCNFDQYMLNLDPVSGYMESNFGKEFGERYVEDFLFPYAKLNLTKAT